MPDGVQGQVGGSSNWWRRNGASSVDGGIQLLYCIGYGRCGACCLAAPLVQNQGIFTQLCLTGCRQAAAITNLLTNFFGKQRGFLLAAAGTMVLWQMIVAEGVLLRCQLRLTVEAGLRPTYVLRAIE